MKRGQVVLSLLLIVAGMVICAGHASAFSIDLTFPNDSGPLMTYATITGYVDSADDSIFHFLMNRPKGLSSVLN